MKLFTSKKAMKRTLALSAAMIFAAASIWGCASKTSNEATEEVTEATEAEAEGLFTPGTYTGTAQGFGGEITATVVLSADKIESVKVEGDAETDGIGSIALEQLPAAIEARQATDVDVISSATVTSNAIIEAVNAALESAGVDPATLVGVAEEAGDKTDEVIDVDIVIVGAGGAGMTAAITATQAGYDVILVEKMPMVGGNTSKATAGMNAAETKFQAEQGIEDTVEDFVTDTMEGGYNVNNIDLVRAMAENSADGIEWLDSIGAPLPKISFTGGASQSRVHAPEGGSAVGTFLVETFSKNLEELGVEILLNTTATEIIMEDGAAVGIAAESASADYTINAKAVIVTTGGFGYNEDLYTQYKPEYKGFVTTNTPGATGDGIVMVEAIGGGLVDMEQIQIHPTVEQETSIMITEAVRGNGAILVNQNGGRFIDEMETRDVVSAAVIDQDGGYAYIIFDQNLRENLAAVETYFKNDIVIEGETIEDLAEAMGADAAVLAETLEVWNKAVADQNDEAFGRTTAMGADLSVGPFYAIKLAPGVHHTMGGVEINTSAQVISVDGDVIPGLFAAGEVTGGVHGANRIGGNAVADIVVFGRIAANSAIALIEE